jgi:hypothetical protein
MGRVIHQLIPMMHILSEKCGRRDQGLTPLNQGSGTQTLSFAVLKFCGATSCPYFERITLPILLKVNAIHL